MILDGEQILSDAQAITVGVQISTNVMDLGVPGTPGAPNNNQLAQDIAKGKEVPVGISVQTAFAGGTSTLIELVVADNAALTTNPTVVGSTGVIALAALTLGANFSIVGLNIGAAQRFLGARYTTVGTHTAGNFDLYLPSSIQTNFTG